MKSQINERSSAIDSKHLVQVERAEVIARKVARLGRKELWCDCQELLPQDGKVPLRFKSRICQIQKCKKC